MLAQMGNHLRGVVDTAIVGRLGAVELAAVGLGNILYFTISIAGFGMIMGFDPLISQALGAGKSGLARGLWWQSVWCGLGLGLVLVVPVLATPLLFTPLEVKPEVASLCSEYMSVRVLALVPVCVFMGARSYLQSVEHTRPLVVAMVVSNITNVALTWWWVFGGADLPAWTGVLRQMPALGVFGSALATVVSALIQLAIVLWSVRAIGQTLPKTETWSRRFSWPDIRRALLVGTPIGLQMFAEVGSFALVGLLAGRMGERELAAHQAALSLCSLMFAATIGMAQAGSVRVGLAVGSQNSRQARRAGAIALVSAVVWMTLSASMFWTFPRAVASLMTDAEDVLIVAIPLLAVAAVFQISDGLQVVCAGVLRGAGDTTFAFVSNMIGHYALGFPVALLCGFWLDMGVEGLWWGLCVGLSAVALALLVHFWRVTGRPIKAL